MIKPVIISVVASLVIVFLYWLIKDLRKDDSPQSPLNYITVFDYVVKRKRRSLNYFLFRFIPPTLIFLLLLGVLQTYTTVQNYIPYTLLCAAIYLLIRDARQFFKEGLTSMKVIYAFNAMAILAISFMVGLAGSFFNISFIVPDLDSIINDAWSGIFISIILLIFIKITDMRDRDEEILQSKGSSKVTDYIISSFNEMHEKYGRLIENQLQEANELEMQYLIYSVLIYENLNRPDFIRKIEKWWQKISKQEVSVAIAQIKTKVNISDDESVTMLIKLVLDNSKKNKRAIDLDDISINQLKNLLNGYNVGDKYIQQINEVLLLLRQNISL